jgi:chemotaxis protein methyltransferase CheR
LYDRAQIYATDLSPEALEQAKQGIYTEDRLGLFAKNHAEAGGRVELSSHCTAAYGGIAIKESLRRNILFFHHDLVSDHAFGEMHVIFCRNVLIYFNAELRERVITKFAASLCPGGFLCLGSSEHLRRTTATSTFREFSSDARIYRHEAEP